MRPLTVERGPEGRLATYFRVSAGAKGGEPVTVRVGKEGRYACLTCRTADTCPHARAAEEFDRESSTTAPAAA